MTRVDILRDVQLDTSIKFKVGDMLCTGSGALAKSLNTVNKYSNYCIQL